MTRWLLWVLVLGLVGAVEAAPHRTRFVRTKMTPQGGVFQTATVRYRKPSSPVEIALCAVVHLGDTRYFGNLRRLLAAADLVLYEAVQVGRDAHPVPATDRWLDPAAAIGNLLGLIHQASALDYRSRNFVWADVTLDELWNTGGGDILDALTSGGPTASAALTDGLSNLLLSMLDPRAARGQLALVLAKSFDDLPALLGKQLSKPLIQLRNNRCFQVLDAQLGTLSSGTLVVLYGAGHMPDMDRRLLERGYVPVRTTWYSAWTY